jgi:hypothetical protein
MDRLRKTASSSGPLSRSWLAARKNPGFLGSVILHLLVMGILGASVGRSVFPPVEEAIPVELWIEPDPAPPRPDQPDGATHPPAASSAIDPAPASPDRMPPETPNIVQAPAMLSDKVLNDPRSRSMRQALARFDDETRMEQLCDIEAMAQIAARIPPSKEPFLPDRLVAYAMADTRRDGDTIRADGAAFRSLKRWYRLTFTCRLAPRGQEIAALEFTTGAPIPRRLWERYNLPPEY